MGGVPMVSKSVLQEQMAKQEYKYGFVADLDEDTVPKGLSEDVVRLISRKKKEPEWMTEWRLRAYRHWLTMKEPTWSNVRYPPIDYQNIIYYAAPKPKKEVKSLEDVDPEIRALYAKLGIPLQEQERLAGVAVDAVLDSVSVATTFKDKLADLGIIFCSFSEAVLEHPELVRKYLGSVVPFNDNFFAALNSAVFSDGSFAYVPSGVRCPMELSTYFRINAMDTGQFETGSSITWKYPSCILQGDNSQGEFYSVAVVNNYQQADTGTKMLHIGKNTKSTIISKGISAGYGRNTYRGRVQIHKGASNARNYSQCDSLLIGSTCAAFTFPDIQVQEPTAQMEHEASTSKIGDEQLFYCQTRGITPEDATNMIVNGFCKQVFLKLPMEFAVEAQKLIGVSLNLEGTVG